MKILNVQWFNNVGIVTIDNGFEIKTYIKQVEGFDEQEDIQTGAILTGPGSTGSKKYIVCPQCHYQIILEAIR